jgi:hypothetical protein
MRISTRNLGANRLMVRAAIEWYANYLMGSRLAKNISIEVIGQDDLVDGFAHGTCTAAYWSFGPAVRAFELNLYNCLDNLELLRVVAHEMVHVRQMARDQMRDIWIPNKGTYVKWYDKIIDPRDIEYEQLPWEIEAFELEYALRDMYISYLNGKE